MRSPVWRIVLAATAVFTLLVAVLLVRSSTTEVPAVSPVDVALPALDENVLAKRLSEAIRFKTVSSQQGPTAEAQAAFSAFHVFLKEGFPLVHSQLSRREFGDAGALYTWQGSNPELPAMLLLAHTDVVPAEPKDWKHPPFSGAIADGYIWGRGTLDCKNNVVGILEATEELLRAGFQPEATIQFAFGHDEEVGGQDGAVRIAEHLRASGRAYRLVLDEGQAVTRGMVPGTETRVAFVATGEKRYLTIKLKARAAGGHSSMPPPQTAIGDLSRAIAALEANPFPQKLQDPARAGFERIAPVMEFPKRVVFSNLWLFSGLLKRDLMRQPATAATLHTTMAATMLSAGTRENVLAKEATATVNLRIYPGTTHDEVRSHLERVIDNPEIEIDMGERWSGDNPISDHRSETFAGFERIVRTVFPDVVVAPGLLSGATDSRHYLSLSDNVYRFTPVEFTPEDTARVHGLNERISIKAYADVVRYYMVLMQAQP